MTSTVATAPPRISRPAIRQKAQPNPDILLSSIKYPESDGKPMADNTKQFTRVVSIKGGVGAIYHNDPNVFVAGDLLWYPVEGDNRICTAPDVLVVIGRPKGDRGSYMQWLEDDIPPQVVFEILSPSNTAQEMRQKFRFYERYGVEEYYVYDPDTGDLEGWLRAGNRLHPVDEIDGWVSPRLGIRFALDGIDLNIYRPDGRRFETFEELDQHFEQERQRAEEAVQRAEQERQRAEQATQRVEQERQRAEQERQRAEQATQRVEQERQRAEQERQRAEEAQLRAEHALQRLDEERKRAERLTARLVQFGLPTNGDSAPSASS